MVVLTVDDAGRKFGENTIKRFAFFNFLTRILTRVLRDALTIVGAILGIFILHSLFFWLSGDPERAFDVAAYIIETIELGWDLVRILWNPVAEIFNAAAIPLWNGLVYYFVEPAVFLVLEVFSLIFLQHSYEGLIPEESLPYGGFVCSLDDEASAAFCGRVAAYQARLAAGSSDVKTQSAVFGVETARRLSELVEDGQVVIPEIDLGDLTGALDGVATQGLLIGGSTADLGFSVAHNVFSTVAVFLFDAFFFILQSLVDILKLLVKSGFLSTILGIGLDFLLIMGLEVALPLLFATIDAVVCVFQLFLPRSWPEQLECAERTCFQGSNAAADFWIFSSIPQVTQRFGIILEATLNSRTGKSFTGGQAVDIGVSDLDEVFPSLSGTGCAACFTCRYTRSNSLPDDCLFHVQVTTHNPFENARSTGSPSSASFGSSPRRRFRCLIKETMLPHTAT